VQVRCDEGIANHIGPESCVAHREMRGEALAGVRIGQPLVRQESWRDPAGESPVQVRGSARLVASVASCSVTTTTKRTQRSCRVWD
jgi:hypothetical protein